MNGRRLIHAPFQSSRTRLRMLSLCAAGGDTDPCRLASPGPPLPLSLSHATPGALAGVSRECVLRRQGGSGRRQCLTGVDHADRWSAERCQAPDEGCCCARRSTTGSQQGRE
ncbi:hypothetical protein VFPFJ_02487 [Purpureocillium lilacinum]|uniref:Uncharacterized protein n=1 Tax=Purpureocillium lilacinum TaxID=33203 RepID=A0A179GNI2_PURLI|nr:hypothetical protein VFPFJ_02487 [Purpureocillium lilacinum]OAQ78930.1 hypothetical protein VFPBJ_07051 [Purpureocillium lilacinum]OAQ93326.1 hypothetical protein VFPFJ_02487 [Purpureocillium lilacinum]